MMASKQGGQKYFFEKQYLNTLKNPRQNNCILFGPDTGICQTKMMEKAFKDQKSSNEGNNLPPHVFGHADKDFLFNDGWD